MTVKDKSLTNMTILRTQHLADAMGVHYQTINNWRRQGRIPFMQPSRTVFYDLDAVRNAISHKRIGSQMIAATEKTTTKKDRKL
jgi:predicted site-specific integrase-resolvase